MRTFRETLGRVCKHPALFVGRADFALAAAYLNGYEAALCDRASGPEPTGLAGFQEWLSVRLDSCCKSVWQEIILREDTGPDKFAALERLYEEFERDRGARGLAAILADFERLQRASLVGARERSCWCELPAAEREGWRSGRGRS